MRHPSRFLLLGLSASFVAAPAAAVRPSPASLYIHARAAEAAGDVREASAGFAVLLAANPANTNIATRAYRQALSSGNMELAVRAARLLETRRALPSDARLLLALGLAAVPAVLVTLLLARIPDTARWYLLKGRVDDAYRDRLRARVGAARCDRRVASRATPG